jgi:WD40 repeat protein
MREYAGPTEHVGQLAFVPGDPPRLLAGTRSGAFVWELGRADPVRVPWDFGTDTPPVTISPNGRWLAAYMTNDQRCWDLDATPIGPPIGLSVSDLLAARLVGGEPELTAVCRHATSDRLMVRTVSFGKLRSEKLSATRAVLPVPTELSSQVATLKPGDWLHAAVLSEDGRRLALTAREKAVHVWDVGADGPPRTASLRGFPCGLTFSPDSSQLVIDAGTTIYIHDAKTLDLLASWKAKYSYVPGLAWSPDGKLLARTDNTTTVRVYDVATGRQVMAVGGKRGRLVCAAFSPDGLTLATATSGGPIRVWDVE